MEFGEFVHLWATHKLSLDEPGDSGLREAEELRRPGLLDCLPGVMRAYDARSVVCSVIGSPPRPRRIPTSRLPEKVVAPSTVARATFYLQGFGRDLFGGECSAGAHGGEATSQSPSPGEPSPGEWLQQTIETTTHAFDEYKQLRSAYESNYPHSRRPPPKATTARGGGPGAGALPPLACRGNRRPSMWRQPESSGAERHTERPGAEPHGAESPEESDLPRGSSSVYEAVEDELLHARARPALGDAEAEPGSPARPGRTSPTPRFTVARGGASVQALQTIGISGKDMQFL